MSAPKNPENNPHWHRQAIAAAILCSQGKKPKEIARDLDKSKSEISEFLKFTRQRGYLSGAPALLRHNINDVVWDETMREFFGDADFTADVLKALPKELQNALHFEARVMFGSYVEFIHGAAVHVAHLLEWARKVGVMWGRTIHLLVENIKAHGEHLNRAKLARIECVPLCGDPIHLMNQRRLIYSASWLAVDLENAVRPPASRRNEFPCLTGAPAYVSIEARDGASLDRTNWPNILNQSPGYEKILGRPTGQKRLADEVDTVITGAGIVASDSLPWSPAKQAAGTDGPSTGDLIEERLQQEGPEVRAKLPRLIYGDIGGVLLSRSGLTRKEQELVDDLNDGWTGLHERDLVRIARAAKKNGAPGIVVIASGATKGELLHAAIQRGLVNHLVVNELLKEKLTELAAPKTS